MRQTDLMLAFLLFSTITLGQSTIKVKEGDKSKMNFEMGGWFFKNNLPDGHYISYRNNDTLNFGKEIIIKNGKKNGLEIRYTFDGKTKYLETNWKNNQRDGTTTYYGGNGELHCIEYQVNFSNDIINGHFLKNTPFCCKEYSGFYKNGIRDSIWNYYEPYDKSRLDSSNYWLSKTYRYINGLPFLISAWNKEGQMTVNTGNGVIVNSDGFYTTTTYYVNGLKGGLEIQHKPNGDTVYLRKYDNDILIYERQFIDLDITSDSTSYGEIVNVGSINTLYPAHSYLYSISEWLPANNLLTDTTKSWIDTHITDIYYKKITRINVSNKNGTWAIYFKNGIPAMEGKYLNGKRIGEWRWKYPNGTDRLKVDFDQNNWQHFDTTGTAISYFKNEYLTRLTDSFWSGDSFLKQLGTNEIRLRNHNNFDDTHTLKFFIDGKIGILNWGNRSYDFIGEYYLIGETITLNIKTDKFNSFKSYRIVENKKGEISLKK